VLASGETRRSAALDRRAARPALIGYGFLDAIDDPHVDGTFRGLERKPELFLKAQRRVDCGVRTSAIRSLAPTA